MSEAGVLDCATPNARSVDALYGDGSDGDVTINVNTTLTRDTYYDDLTVEPGKTLNPGGYRIFVSGTLTLGDGAAIARDGANGADCCPMLFPGTLGHSGAGGLFVGGDSVNSSLGGSGGAGGSVAGFPGKSGGFATPPPAEAGGTQVFRQALSALSGRTLEGPLVNGGAGGGAGALILAGGGGGGVVVVITATAKPAAMTLSAAGGSGAQPGNPGFTAWLN